MMAKLKENLKGSQFLVLTVTAVLLIAGWGNVLWQYISIEAAVIQSFQQAQLEIVKSSALAAQQYATEQLAQGRTDEVDRIEVEIQEKFVAPIQLLNSSNTAWIIGSDNTMVFDESVDFPYHDIPITDFLDLQAQRGGASDYTGMRDDVLNRREGVGKYIWVSQSGWSITGGLEQGWEIGAWTPVEVTENTKWMIGMTTKLTDIRVSTGAAQSVFLSVLTMSLVTVIVVGFVVYSFRNRKQVVQLQQQVVDLQIKIDKVEKARQVEAIVDTGYFKDLRSQARSLREQSRRRRTPRS